MLLLFRSLLLFLVFLCFLHPIFPFSGIYHCVFHQFCPFFYMFLKSIVLCFPDHWFHFCRVVVNITALLLLLHKFGFSEMLFSQLTLHFLLDLTLPSFYDFLLLFHRIVLELAKEIFPKMFPWFLLKSVFRDTFLCVFRECNEERPFCLQHQDLPSALLSF